MTSFRCFLRFVALSLVILQAACSSLPTTEDQPTVFFPQPPVAPRVQFLRSVNVGSDIEEGQSGLDTLLFGEVEIEKAFMTPYGVVPFKGIFYVCDIQQSAVLTVDFVGKKFSYLELTGRGAVQKPVNLAFAPDGRLFVADVARYQVIVYDSEFNYLSEIGPFGENSKIVDVEVDDGKLYCLDSGRGEVHVMDLETYEEILVFGRDLAQPHRLNRPTNMSIGEDGACYVVDTVMCNVSVWDKDGNFEKTIGMPGDVVGHFGRPKGIAFDNDLLYVIDAAFENCQIFNLDGDPLMFFGGPGVNPGDLYLPACVWVGEEGLDLFEEYFDESFHAEKLIAVTSLFGPAKLSFFALGKADGFDYTENEAARGIGSFVSEDIEANSIENKPEE
jgi:sugar lactone lactonase YvrE